MAMDDLPDDILSNIFIRLRAKQLAQMRCISKPWNALLSQPSLVKSHLERSIHNSDGILLVFSEIFRFGSHNFTVHPSGSPHMRLTDFIKVQLDTQPYPGYGYGDIIGSVNGLICFRYRTSPDFDLIYIWNPSLSAVLTLPPYSVSPHFDNYKTSNFFRFGFDPETNDYKVIKSTEGVRLANKMFNVKNNGYCSSRICLQIEIYSMRKGSWKLFTQKIPSHISWDCYHVQFYLGGHHPHLHWLGETEYGGNSTELIVAFDLGTETFHEIPLPDSISNRDGSRCNYLGVLAGKLCVMSIVVSDRECEVWVMDEYGVAESWVKHHVFTPFGGYFKPYGFTFHNEFLFKDDPHGLALYDPVAAKRKFFMFDGPFRFEVRVVEYVDSLVWVTPDKKRNSLTSMLKSFLHAFLGFLINYRFWSW